MEKEIKRRRLKGVVTSDKMEKTVVVTVTTSKKHSKYLKYFNKSSKFKAHDEDNQYKVDDEVVIEEGRPISKDKRWTVIGLVEKKNNSQ
ncbi:MAG: 30S ribosomal protein S17 [Patescibacteria group bacterium]